MKNEGLDGGYKDEVLSCCMFETYCWHASLFYSLTMHPSPQAFLFWTTPLWEYKLSRCWVFYGRNVQFDDDLLSASRFV